MRTCSDGSGLRFRGSRTASQWCLRYPPTYFANPSGEEPRDSQNDKRPTRPVAPKIGWTITLVTWNSNARVIVSDMVPTDPSVKNISCGL
jgi:hypothetical protein